MLDTRIGLRKYMGFSGRETKNMKWSDLEQVLEEMIDDAVNNLEAGDGVTWEPVSAPSSRSKLRKWWGV